MEGHELEDITGGDIESSVERQQFSLPRADGGRDAWLFLAATFILEALVWGKLGYKSSNKSKAVDTDISLKYHQVFLSVSVFLKHTTRLMSRFFEIQMVSLPLAPPLR